MKRATYLPIVIAVLTALAPAAEGADLPRIELTILSAPKETAASSSFYLRVRLVNVGAVPVRGCQVELGRLLSAEPCVTLGYRFWKPPGRLQLDGVDTLEILSRTDLLRPGEQLERSLRLVSASQSQTGTLHLYAISGRPGELRWVHQEIPIAVGAPPFEVRRREIITRCLVALYLLGLAWTLFRLAVGVSHGRKRWPCSS
jgi:hypothetical protein